MAQRPCKLALEDGTVYTGEAFPTRRLEWRFRLADGSEMTGAVKGQPVFIDTGYGRVEGPFVLYERQRGKVGQAPAEMTYLSRIIVSRRLMDHVRSARREVSETRRAGTEQ